MVGEKQCELLRHSDENDIVTKVTNFMLFGHSYCCEAELMMRVLSC